MEDSEGNKEGPCRDGAQKTPQVSQECVLLRRLLLGLENMESRMDRMEEQLKEIAAMFSGGEGCLAQPQLGEFHQLVQELRLDGHRFQRYFRLDCEQFDRLLATVGPLIARADTTYRQAIPPAERLAICLW
ncbi:hypothetical protein SKAU_G00236300 [Synaphobranchus kaupii]|uniref:Uncharacterized protein n=1 Tax=Synaphobranchus kaupii TaxID=118154 RepID=A0A9Q1F731_SYNKA|nr:hypothetical protein SKAU_G00236300 [Synaphobranchus kaupii]